jgi:NitT/TauT family transport system permease protein
MAGSLLVLGLFWHVLAVVLQNRYRRHRSPFSTSCFEAESGEKRSIRRGGLARVAIAFIFSMFIGTAIGPCSANIKLRDKFFDAWLTLFQPAGARNDYALLHLVRADGRRGHRSRSR